jgi:hypothetical protein
VAELDIGVVLWSITIGIIVVLLAVDLLAAALRPHQVGFREAALWSIFYIGVAVGFGSGSPQRTGRVSVPSSSPDTSLRRACQSTTCSSS